MLRATKHDQFAARDFARLKSLGIRTARSGIVWPEIEDRTGSYHFADTLKYVRAAHDAGVQIVWDVCHYGWPDNIDIYSSRFVDSFARFAASFTRLLLDETNDVPILCPINEISYFSWAGGDMAYMNPHTKNRGHDLKAQLVRASIAGIEAIWDVAPQARIANIDPVIHIVPNPMLPNDTAPAEAYRRAQFQAWDMLSGRVQPELGGNEKYLDIIGVNYYPKNQWVNFGKPLKPHHAQYRPFHDILTEVHTRYQRPIFISETGTEDDERAGWLRYVAGETAVAIRNGLPIEGLCLYPILNHPGWIDDRHCHNGLWCYANDAGDREIYEPLADEIVRQGDVITSAQMQHTGAW